MDIFLNSHRGNLQSPHIVIDSIPPYMTQRTLFFKHFWCPSFSPAETAKQVESLQLTTPKQKNTNIFVASLQH